MSTAMPHASIADQAQQLVNTQQTLHLATADADGQLEASYAPFVQKEGHYYVYLSELAAHCHNLQSQGRCALLVIEDEQAAKTPFARQRLSLHCSARELARGSAAFQQMMQAFCSKFGKFFMVIHEMLDFHLFEITPERGGYVAGFGRAYAFEGKDLRQLHWRHEQGHRDGRDPAARTTQTPGMAANDPIKADASRAGLQNSTEKC